MFSRSTLLHLRIPFSVFLMPVFLFALSQVAQAEMWRIGFVFIIVHLFLYPASNGFNSYYDKDQESIGGLEKPPAVTPDLLYISLIFDGIALLLGLFINVPFALMLLVYGLISKAYSHPAIRLKKHAWLGLLTVAVFQGCFTFYMCAVGLSDQGWHVLENRQIVLAGVLSSLLLLGSYPMTQVYQHAEDNRRGDRTISIRLGIRGTFIWTGLVFTLAMGGFFLFFSRFYSPDIFVLFALMLLHVLVFFFWWALRVWRNPVAANYRNTMRLNLISSICLAGFFLFLFWLSRL